MPLKPATGYKPNRLEGSKPGSDPVATSAKPDDYALRMRMKTEAHSKRAAML